MKKLLFIACTLIMIGCFELNSKQREEHRSLCDNRIYYAPNGCEYYLYFGYTSIPIHKQDCKKCAERRKQEMRKLIKELGELKSE